MQLFSLVNHEQKFFGFPEENAVKKCIVQIVKKKKNKAHSKKSVYVPEPFARCEARKSRIWESCEGGVIFYLDSFDFFDFFICYKT